MELQGGRFDFPDRLFGSIKQTWLACTNSLSTYKELIPEFYYMPEFLENINRFNFGKRQNGEGVDEVELPAYWFFFLILISTYIVVLNQSGQTHLTAPPSEYFSRT